MPKEKIAIAGNIAFLYLAIGSLISLLPPFYPSEAESKGLTASQYGLVFGTAPLTMLIFGPIFGRYGSKIGAKLCFVSGALLQGFSGVFFAFLPYCENAYAFIGLSYILRIAEGLGTSMCWSSSLVVLQSIFPNKDAVIMSCTQTFFGLGYMLGPMLGAYLYQVGGFSLPFLVVGLCDIVLSLFLVISIPNHSSINATSSEYTDNETCSGNTIETSPLVEKENEQNEIGFRHFLEQPQMLLPFIDLFAAMCGNGMLESMLQPHLKIYGASKIDVGITFLLYGCFYMVANLIVGQIIDKFGKPLLLSSIGNALFIVVFTFIGPLPFISVTLTLEILKGVMAVAGLSYATIIVSSFSHAQDKAFRCGHKNKINTHLMISGLWLSAFSLGNFVGPTVAGALVEKYGFQWTTLAFVILFVVVIFKDIIESLAEIHHAPKK